MAENMCKSKAFENQYRNSERQHWKATDVKELRKNAKKGKSRNKEFMQSKDLTVAIFC